MCKYWPIFVFLLTGSVVDTFAQRSADLDSLIEYAHDNYRKHPSEAISVGLEAEKGTDPQIRARGAYLLMKAYDRAGKPDSALYFGGKAVSRIEAFDRPETEAKYLRDYARLLRNLGQAKQALEQYRKALRIYEAMPDSEGIAFIENSIGISYKKMGDYDVALQHYRRALNIRTKLGQQNQMAQVTNNIGNVLRYRGALDSALNHYIRALEVFEALGDSNNMSKSLNNIGLVHKTNGNDSLALTYYRRVEQIRMLRSDERGLTAIRNNMAIIYRENGLSDSAIAYFEQNLQYAIEHGIKDAEGLARHNLASVYMDERDWPKAISGFKAALSIRTELNDRFGIASCNQNLAESYRRMGQYKTAIPYAKEALRMSQEIGSGMQTASIYKTLHESHAALGNYEKAYRYLNLEKAIADSLLNEERQSAIAEMEAKYENEKREREIEQAKQQNALQTEKIKRTQNTRNFLFAIICIGLVVVFLLFRQARSLRKANRLLTRQKEKLAQNAEEKEMLLKEIHHRVKNNLQVVSSLLNMQSREVHDDKVLNALKEGRDRVHSMALVHQMFYQVNEESAKIEADKYVEQLCLSLMRSYGANNEGIDLKLNIKPTMLDVDRATLVGLIINELVSNSLKYAFDGQANKQLSVSLWSDSKNHLLQVEDNGIGKKASKRSPDAFGLKLVESMTKKLKGKMTSVSTDGYSTRIEFPKNQ